MRATRWALVCGLVAVGAVACNSVLGIQDVNVVGSGGASGGAGASGAGTSGGAGASGASSAGAGGVSGAAGASGSGGAGGAMTLGTTCLPMGSGGNGPLLGDAKSPGGFAWALGTFETVAGKGTVSIGRVAVDSSGAPFIAGTVQGTADFGRGCVVQVPSGQIDIFVAKLGVDGNVAWVVTAQGSTSATVADLLVADDAAWLVGSFSGTVSLGGTVIGPSTTERALLMRVVGPGTAWTIRPAAGSTSSGLTSLARAADGGVYATGWFDDSVSWSIGSGQPPINVAAPSPGHASQVLWRFDSTGRAIWGASFGTFTAGFKPRAFVAADPTNPSSFAVAGTITLGDQLSLAGAKIMGTSIGTTGFAAQLTDGATGPTPVLSHTYPGMTGNTSLSALAFDHSGALVLGGALTGKAQLGTTLVTATQNQ